MNEELQFQADVIRTLVMETFNYSSQEAIKYIQEHNGIKDPEKIIEACTVAIDVKEVMAEVR